MVIVISLDHCPLESTMANLSTLPQDHFFALCTMDDRRKIQVRKFSWEREKAPFYEVPEAVASIEEHPSIAKHLNSSTMKSAGRRNAKVVIYKVNSKTNHPTLTTAGSLYLNGANQFVIGNQPLSKESAFNASTLIADLWGNEADKSASASQILQKFSE